jgi:sulfane dehydrogenase subunit SoxC
VITFPRAQQLPGRGFYEISGLAWSGGGAIKLVEVSTDGGKRWNKAEIKGRRSAWRIPVSVISGIGTDKRPRLQSRAPTRLGQVQPSRAADREVLEQALRPDVQRAGLDNSIQPWKIAAMGA